MPNPSDILGGLPREIIDTINGTATARPKPSEILGGYHKELIDALSGLAHLDSPVLTGTPTAPTADAGDESAQIATTEFVQQEITANPAHLELMSPTTIGGAKLGDGLALTDGALSIDPEPQESTGEVRGAIASLTAKGWATQDGTPAPDAPVPIQVARGRNLLFKRINNAVMNTSGVIVGNTGIDCVVAKVKKDCTYITTITRSTVTVSFYTTEPELGSASYDGSRLNQSDKTFVAPIDGYVVIWITSDDLTPQLELGSTATPYVPYGHVGVEVRQGSTLISTIPVPLPSKGYAASLPDGTADVLTIDGAGKVEWVSAVGHIESYAGESVGAVYLSTTGELTTGAEVYYPLATPITEQVGYIDWPSIPDGATITCPELDALGVRYLIGNGVATMARQWYERAKSEYEGRILALEQAVAELATA